MNTTNPSDTSMATDELSTSSSPLFNAFLLLGFAWMAITTIAAMNADAAQTSPTSVESDTILASEPLTKR